MLDRRYFEQRWNDFYDKQQRRIDVTRRAVQLSIDDIEYIRETLAFALRQAVDFEFDRGRLYLVIE